MSSVSLTIVILTYNEEANLSYCLSSVQGVANRVLIVDSGSTDRTVEIARNYSAQVLSHPWQTYADQFNWALEQLESTDDWVMRLDADEVLTPDLARELSQVLPFLPSEVSGLYVKRRVYFMGRWIRHGSYYPTWLLRVFRHGVAHCEDRWMDEHMVLSHGQTRQLKYDIIDQNHKGLSFWTIKHDSYARREALDLAGEAQAAGAQMIQPSLLGAQDQRKRWLKGNVYARAPLFWRAGAYFIYRYFLRLGFLDGVEGLIFHVLQGFWYRFYVDAKIWEARNSGTPASTEANSNA